MVTSMQHLPQHPVLASLTPQTLAVIVGAGESGQAAARLLAHKGVRVRILERDSAGITPAFQEEIRTSGMELLCGAHTPEQFSGADFVVTSPGVPLHVLAPFLTAAGNPPLLGEMELALAFTHEPILAVTGTSGKTTTVSLAAAMLNAAGKTVFLGGNIGTPLSSYVLGQEKADVLVLEISSFQLQGCHTLHPHVAMIINLTENHLDHHKTMQEYTDAKFSIFALQNADNFAILPPELAEEYHRRGHAAPLEVFTATNRFPHMQLAGKHNAANAEAAYLACRVFGVSEEAAAKAVAEFLPLRHRLETAARHADVLYVNDSKCTTVEAMRAALESFDTPVILLAGGKFKGGDLASLRSLLQKQVKAVVLFGASRDIFETAWAGAAPITWDANLDAAFARAAGLATAHDVVLLSPATASYDLYNNYKERGDHFCRLASALSAHGARP